MIPQGKHRVIEEIEKKRLKGQQIHFLTGSAISTGDYYFYDFFYGIKNLDETLMIYYFKEHDEFDFFIHVVNSNSNIKCYARDEKQSNGVRLLKNFNDILTKPSTPTGFGAGLKRNKPQAEADSSTSEGHSEADLKKDAGKAAEDLNAQDEEISIRLNKLTQEIKKNNKRFLILVENIEWVANLYGTEPKMDWIAQLQDPIWQKARKLMVIVTIKDFELLKKYQFNEEETFIGNPTAEEIFFAYWRHILKNTAEKYKFNILLLNKIAHSMSVGKKSLLQCIRILRRVLVENSIELKVDDFSQAAEQNIEEKVTWDDVFLEEETRKSIEGAIDSFMCEDEGHEARKGFILTGAPGTGKTMIAKALANEKHCYFMAPTLSELKGEYIGHSCANVKRVFAEARGNQPTILFIDEADTVFPSRDLGGNDTDPYTLEMVNQFLQELDGAKTGKQKIFTIAATNRVEVVDGAIRSRLSGTPIQIPLPSKEVRRKLFNKKLSPFTLDKAPFLEEVMLKSENMSGRDIDNCTKKLKEWGISEYIGDYENAYVLFKKYFEEAEVSFITECINEGVFSKENVVIPSRNKDRLDSVIGYDNLKNEIKKQVDFITADVQKKEQYKEFGVLAPKGVIMYGPPGNAKSSLAKAIAGEYGFYFFKILSKDFVSALPERQIKLLNDIFSRTERFSKLMSSPGIVLFFDEFDSLAGNQILNPVVRGTLLNFIDDKNGLRSDNSKILFMTATNFYNVIDEAIKRKGRIDSHLFMDNPSCEEGEKILGTKFKNDKKVETVPQGIIKKAYAALCDSIKKDPEKKKKILIELFGNGEIFEQLNDTSKNIVKKKLEDLRPSGSEINNLYNYLKEKAFLKQQFSRDNKLIISLEEKIN